MSYSKGSKIAKVQWICTITDLDYMCVDLATGSFLVALVLKYLLGLLDEYYHP